MHAPPKRSGRLTGSLVATATWSLLGLAACGSDDQAIPDMATPQSPGPPKTATSVASIDRPLAAALTPDGKTVYITAHDASGLAQLYTVSASGGTPTKIVTSVPLSHPLGMDISPDGTSLFIVDSAGGAEDAGAVYSGTTAGVLNGTSFTGVRAPAGVAVSGDGKTVYVTGFDASTGQPGLFSAAASGGTLTAVAKGAPFKAPSAVTVTADGTVYVVDVAAMGMNQGGVIKVKANAATLFTSQALTVGFSAGISPNGVGSNDLLVTGNTGLGSGLINNVNTVGGVAAITLNSTLFDPANIQRAANVSVWVTVDSVNATQPTAGQQLGQVYVLTP